MGPCTSHILWREASQKAVHERAMFAGLVNISARQSSGESPIVFRDRLGTIMWMCCIGAYRMCSDLQRNQAGSNKPYLYFVYDLCVPSLLILSCPATYDFESRNLEIAESGVPRRRVIPLAIAHGMTLVALWHSPPLIRPPNFTFTQYLFELLWS